MVGVFDFLLVILVLLLVLSDLGSRISLHPIQVQIQLLQLVSQLVLLLLPLILHLDHPGVGVPSLVLVEVKLLGLELPALFLELVVLLFDQLQRIRFHD